MRHLFAAAALFVLTVACDGAQNVAETPPTEAARTLAPTDLSAFFDCLRENSRTVVAAHRGGPAPGFAENAIPTFEHTVSAIPALLEIDVARTTDGHLILMHDDTVDRTTTGSGAVRDMTLAQIRALKLEDENGQELDATVPTLREALDWAAGKTILELDIKRGVAYEDVVAEVRDAGAQDRVILITYSPEAALRLFSVAPEMMISVNIATEDDVSELESAGFNLENMLAWTGTDEPNSGLNVALAQRGIEVLFGTLGGGNSWDERFARDGREQYAAFADTGIELIATDRPREAVSDLDANDGTDGYAALQCVGAH